MEMNESKLENEKDNKGCFVSTLSEDEQRKQDEITERNMKKAEERRNELLTPKEVSDVYMDADELCMKNYKQIEFQRRFERNVHNPGKIFISDFTKVRWKNLSKKMKVCAVFVTCGFSFMMIMSIVSAIMAPFVISNLNTTGDTQNELDKLHSRINNEKQSVLWLNHTLSTLREEFSDLQGYDELKRRVMCISQYFFRVGGGLGKGTDESPEEMTYSCLIRSSINSL